MNTIINNDENIYKYKQIQKIFQEKTSQEKIHQKILDIRSLVRNISPIDGKKIFIKNKKKHGGMLDIEKFLGK